jgi:hypothetical protein
MPNVTIAFGARNIYVDDPKHLNLCSKVSPHYLWRSLFFWRDVFPHWNQADKKILTVLFYMGSSIRRRRKRLPIRV